MNNKAKKLNWEAATGTYTYKDFEDGKAVTKTTFQRRVGSENTKSDWVKARAEFCKKPLPHNRGLRLVSLRYNIAILKTFRP